MKITKEINLENFEAWSGARDTLDAIIKAGKAQDMEAIIEDIYPDGIDETSLNDWLRFDAEQIYEMLGIESEE